MDRQENNQPNRNPIRNYWEEYSYVIYHLHIIVYAPIGLFFK